MPKRLPIALLVLLASPPLAAAWRFDAAASRLEFVASFERAAVPGRFTDFDVALADSAAPPAGARLAVTVRTASAVFDSADVTAAVREAAWFDVAQFPAAHFEAAALEAQAAGHYLARGTLELKGVRRELAVPLVWHDAPDGATLAGEFTVLRGAFGIGTGTFEATDEVGAEVRVSFEVHLRRDG